LPDGIFSDQKSQFGFILGGFENKNVCVFYGHLEFFKATWFVCTFDAHFVVTWYFFTRLGKLYQEKSGNPERERSSASK
jgi:hypothetical protein